VTGLLTGRRLAGVGDRRRLPGARRADEHDGDPDDEDHEPGHATGVRELARKSQPRTAAPGASSSRITLTVVIGTRSSA
jgi:hypothetical protein